MEWEVAGVGRKARLELAEPLLTDGWILAKFLFPVLLTWDEANIQPSWSSKLSQ